MDKHTAIPWELEIETDDKEMLPNVFCKIIARGSGTETNPELHIDGWIKPEDAQLFAAAPYLLRALEALTDTSGHIDHGIWSVCTGECELVRASIAKARGKKHTKEEDRMEVKSE